MKSLLANKRNLLLLSLLLCAIFSTFLGNVLYKTVTIDPRIDRGLEVGIDRDGWTTEHAIIKLELKALENSTIKIHLDTWRPKGKGAASVLFRFCSKETGPVLVKESFKDFALPVSPDCSSGDLEIVTTNPFSTPDKRSLGVRVESVDILNPWYQRLAFTTDSWVLLACLSLLAVAVIAIDLSTMAGFALGTFLIVGGGVLYGHRAWDSSSQLFTLWALTISIFVGTILARATSHLQASEDLRPKHSNLLLIAVFIAAFLIRLSGASFGLPYPYHPDEPRKVAIALGMVRTGNLDPNYFLHPTLLIYLTAILSFIAERLHLVSQLRLEDVQYCGRLVSVIAGTLSVPLIYFIGANLKNRRIGIIAAALLAFAPLHVTCSRYLKEDVLLTFFILSSLSLMLFAVKRDRPGLMIFVGLLCGLASSSKYSGLLSTVSLAAAPWVRSKSLRPDPKFLKYSFIGLFLVPIGFLIGCPYSILNNKKFMEHLRAEGEHMELGHHNIAITSWSQFWMYHLSRSIIPGFLWMPTALAAVGLGVALYTRNISYLLICAMLLTFYLPAEWVKAKPPPQPERYVLPCIPFLALLAGCTIDLILRLRCRCVAWTLLIVSIASVLLRSAHLAAELRTDTRVSMRNWVVANIPKDSVIMIDAQAYSAFLPGDRYRLIGLSSVEDRRLMTAEILSSQHVQYLLLTSKSYDRYFLTRNADQVIRARFEDVMKNWPLVRVENKPDASYGFQNPELRLYKVPGSSQ